MCKLNLVNKACGILLLWATAASALPAQTTPAGPPAPTLTTLLSFNAIDADQPTAGLVQGADGNFYGTMTYGGAHGDGTVFKMTPSGKLTTLYSFCQQINNGICTDGSSPYEEKCDGDSL